jgi:hypothetical protein
MASLVVGGNWPNSAYFAIDKGNFWAILGLDLKTGIRSAHKPWNSGGVNLLGEGAL